MKAQRFIEQLKNEGIDSYYGVPDSLLKSICAYIADHVDARHNIITANEGNAIGLACGHYLSTGRPALVYMQNSGQGNVVNPLLSLMDEEVYSIPVLLLIGWRGEPGVHDEPQHVKQGKVTLTLLETMGIDYAVLDEDDEVAAKQIHDACSYMEQHKKPYALIARKKTFDSYTLQNKRVNQAEMSREYAICRVAELLAEDDIIVSTTGQISRELYEYRTNSHSSHQSDFLTVGAMGHASSIAMGVAINKPERRVICMDGDGAFLMHMGAAAIIGNAGLPNMRHIIFNNAAHDSVGSQPTVADELDVEKIALACGYSAYYRANTEQELRAVMPEFLEKQGTSLLEIAVSCGSRSDLGRPKEKPVQNKESFMRFVEEAKTITHPGAVNELFNIIATGGRKKVLVFITEGRKTAFAPVLEQLQALCECEFYTDIAPNPTAEAVQQALQRIQSCPEAIVAIGGGSVIDFAKLYRACSDNETTVEDYFRCKPSLIRKTPLVAVPTTAGTGSEATRFAVVYMNGEKYSLDAAAVMPDYALVDASLMMGASPYIKASCGMDAFAQAIEGYWAKGATPESDEYAVKAIDLCVKHIADFVSGVNEDSAHAMAEAANLAGKCINITRTTAAHALSYKITQKYGLPHGHAVALSLPGLAALHAQEAPADSVLSAKMQKLASLLQIDNNEWRAWFHCLYDRLGLCYDLSKLGMDSVEPIVDGVNCERLANNPVALDRNMLLSVF